MREVFTSVFDLAPIQAEAARSESETSEQDRYVVITDELRTGDPGRVPG